MVVSVKVVLLNGPNFELFEGRTVTLRCVNSTINQTSTVWYKNDKVISNATSRNLTLTLKKSDVGFYKCTINGVNSTNDLNVSVKGMNFGVFLKRYLL